jgi:5-methylcytosine-specific restriction endonuclease McrA
MGHRISRSTRRAVYRRDGFACVDCGFNVPDPGESWDGRGSSPLVDGLTLGHKFPRAQGGRAVEGNLITQCDICNTELADRVWKKEWWMDGTQKQQRRADGYWAQARREEWAERLKGLFE